MIIPFSSPQVTRVHYFTRLLAFLKAKVVKALADFATELKVAKTIHMCFVGIRAELGIHLVGEVDLEVVGVPVCAQLVRYENKYHLLIYTRAHWLQRSCFLHSHR